MDAKYVAFMKEYDTLITRDKTVILFTEPENLIEYLDRNGSLLELGKNDSELLINYMEGHGYSRGESCEMLVRADITEEYCSFMPITKIKTVIDKDNAEEYLADYK